MITVYHLVLQDEDAFEANLSLQDAYFSAKRNKHGHGVIRAIYAGDVIGLNYEKVADVDTNDLDYAFERTNSIDCYWGENEGVTENGGEHRSTCIGDLMLVDGKFFVVAGFGFEEIAINELTEA